MSSRRFWNAAKSLIAVTEEHPFLVSMVDGTLELANFRYYVVQDALYLGDFADCLFLLSESPGIDPQSSEKLKSFAKGASEAELSLHESFFKTWDISAQGVDQMPYCLLYTSYMKRIVTTRSYAEGLACLLPCFWVYMHVGQRMLRLREQLGDTVNRPPQFDAWIDMYGGDEFEKVVQQYIALVDDACSTADETTLQEMERHFIMCCKLEYMFWDQASTLMDWPAILNNDSTGTK
jgi:thiaminase (transcriptional activator TenA)